MEKFLEDRSSSVEADFAKEATALIAAHDGDAFLERLDPSIRSNAEDNLEQIFAEMPSGSLLESKLIGAYWQSFNGKKSSRLVFHNEYENGYAMITAVVAENDSGLALLGFHVQKFSQDLSELHAFSLKGKSVRHLLMLSLLVVLPLFSIAVLVLCVKTPMASKKWRWILFILVGVGSWQLNWTDGATSFGLAQVYLLSASFARASDYSPWIASVSVPLGAIIFLMRRPAIIEKYEASLAASAQFPSDNVAVTTDGSGVTDLE
ncbi:MAG: hypothetical protein KDH09_00725 [Chrysiogenetes bacterium]|nr:hypothetical protein [Chrysiogenetes bacterium]